MAHGRRLNLRIGLILIGWLGGTMCAQAVPSENHSLPAPSDRVLEFTGYAYDAKTSELLYTETHRQQFEQDRLVRDEVSYRDKTGQLFARKSLDFSADLYAPSFVSENLRTGELERGQQGQSGYTISYRENSKSKLRAKTLPSGARIVADAGFDGYVRQALPQLLEGKEVSFDFLVPSQQGALTLRVRADKPKLVQGRETIKIQVDFNNPILRLLAPSLKVTYDVNTGELLEYHGVSNIGDARGSKYRVRIAYPEGQRGQQSAGTQTK